MPTAPHSSLQKNEGGRLEDEETGEDLGLRAVRDSCSSATATAAGACDCSTTNRSVAKPASSAATSAHLRFRENVNWAALAGRGSGRAAGVTGGAGAAGSSPWLHPIRICNLQS
jgi:hypothetical protein